MMGSPLPEIALWLGLGAAMAALYLRLLALGVAAVAGEGRGGMVATAGWLLLRLALAGGAFWGAAGQGAPALLAMLAGFAVVRTVVVRRVGARL